MKNLFSKKSKPMMTKVEEKFQTIVTLIKDLDKKDLNKLIEGMKLVWEGYNKVGQAKTPEEKEVEDIEKAEKALEEESGRN